MHIKKYIRNDIQSKLTELSNEQQEVQNSFSNLEKTNFKNAHYKIEITSFWKNTSGGSETDCTVTVKGTLENAIAESEKEFMRINKRPDVQGRYKAGIVLGNRTFGIPEEYWRQYTMYQKQKQNK